MDMTDLSFQAILDKIVNGTFAERTGAINEYNKRLRCHRLAPKAVAYCKNFLEQGRFLFVDGQEGIDKRKKEVQRLVRDYALDPAELLGVNYL
jgi:hypothetical protein